MCVQASLEEVELEVKDEAVIDLPQATRDGRERGGSGRISGWVDGWRDGWTVRRTDRRTDGWLDGWWIDSWMGRWTDGWERVARSAGQMDGRMDGGTDFSMDGSRDPLMHRSMDGCTNGHIAGWMDGWMHRCIDGWMDGRMDGWDSWVDGSIHRSMYPSTGRGVDVYKGMEDTDGWMWMHSRAIHAFYGISRLLCGISHHDILVITLVMAAHLSRFFTLGPVFVDTCQKCFLVTPVKRVGWHLSKTVSACPCGHGARSARRGKKKLWTSKAVPAQSSAAAK